MYATKPPLFPGAMYQPGHEKTGNKCWWQGAGWWVLMQGATRCTLKHTFGDPEPDPEADLW